MIIEKEWKRSNQENLKKIEELYKHLNDSAESNQKKTHQINNLAKTADDNKKIIQHQTEQTKTIESNYKNSLTGKDQKNNELVTLMDKYGGFYREELNSFPVRHDDWKY